MGSSSSRHPSQLTPLHRAHDHPPAHPSARGAKPSPLPPPLPPTPPHCTVHTTTDRRLAPPPVGVIAHPPHSYTPSLRYYAGSLLRDAHPKMKLVSAASPEPLVATCSSEYNEHDPCWKAFDGDTSHTNGWRSEDVSRGPMMVG